MLHGKHEQHKEAINCDLFSTYLDNGVLVIHTIHTIHSQRDLQISTKQTKELETPSLCLSSCSLVHKTLAVLCKT